jgi:glycosyltransferase involved in cell wall biosynthesis
VKILHILYQSLPQVSGSSIRSRDVLMSQKEIGLDVVAVTSTFQGSKNSNKNEFINGIKYIRTTKNKTTSISDQKKSKFSQLSRFFSLIPFILKLYRIVSKEKPDILHAHAMFYCGIPAIIIGKIKKIPVVYEFRSLWMFQKKRGSKTKMDVFLEDLMLSIETLTLKKADYAIFLNEGLKSYFTQRNIQFEMSAIINNAVNTTYINSLKKKHETKANNEAIVFGYIGTLTSYEGIEFLVEAFQELYENGIKNKLVIYGDGINRGNIIKTIQLKKDIKTIEYRGKIKPHEIAKAYAEIDVIINPRLSTNVTNSVTPLKPLEAFAYNKLFLGSSVLGITALVQNEKTGIIFEAENKESLKNQIQKILNYSALDKSKITDNASKFVLKEKSWKNNAIQYKKIYSTLIFAT